MQPFTQLTGLVAPLDRLNVDTDQIIPKQFLKTIKRTGLREGLFYDWRKTNPGSPVRRACSTFLRNTSPGVPCLK